MPKFTVELSFEYRSTYHIEAECAQEAIDAAEAHDAWKHYGTAIPDEFAHLPVECAGDREFVNDLDEARIFDATGAEIVFD